MARFIKGFGYIVAGAVWILACTHCQTPINSFNLKKSLSTVPNNESVLVEASRTDREDFPMIVRLVGGMREYGLVWGTIEKNAGIELRTAPLETKILQNGIREMYAKIDPGYLEFVEGIALAYGIPASSIDMRYMERDLLMDPRALQLRWACTIVAVKSSDSVIVGRNADMMRNMYGWERFIVKSSLNGERSFVGNALLSPVNLVIDGVNDSGLFVGNMAVCYPDEFNSIGKREYPNHPAVDPNHFMRILLARCATVADAEALAEKVPQWFSDGMHHLLVADSGGDMAIFEWSTDGRFRAIRRDGTWLACANALVGKGDATARMDPKYAVVADCLSNYPVNSMAAVSAVMEGVRVPVAAAKTAKTAWTALYDLNTQSMTVRHDIDGWTTPITAFAPGENGYLNHGQKR